jgi:hypothetical protein
VIHHNYLEVAKGKIMQWKKLLVRIVFWLSMEIVLSLLGLDDIADYSEFIFEKNHVEFSA